MSIKFPEGTRVIVEIPGIIDFEGEAAINVPGAEYTHFINPRDFGKYKVRVAPVEIIPGHLYRDAEGKGYIASHLVPGTLADGRYGYGPGQNFPLPVGLVEVTA